LQPEKVPTHRISLRPRARSPRIGPRSIREQEVSFDLEPDPDDIVMIPEKEGKEKEEEAQESQQEAPTNDEYGVDGQEAQAEEN
jgi:hypothetical protein